MRNYIYVLPQHGLVSNCHGLQKFIMAINLFYFWAGIKYEESKIKKYFSDYFEYLINLSMYVKAPVQNNQKYQTFD